MKKSTKKTKKYEAKIDYRETMQKTLDQILKAEVDMKKYFQSFTDLMSFGREYSPRNLILIAMQSQNAIWTEGFVSWKNKNRHVKAGEKGLLIFAPVPVKKEVKDEKTGEKKTEVAYMNFRHMFVFDYLQTKGEPVPEIEVLLEKRNAAKQALYGLAEKNPDKIFPALYKHAKSQGITIKYKDLGASGGCAYVDGKNLWIDKSLKNADLPTLIHEYAHITLKHNSSQERSEKELEAELTTALVLSALNLDISNSIRYLHNWASKANGNRDDNFYKAFDKACPVALEIIDAINMAV